MPPPSRALRVAASPFRRTSAVSYRALSSAGVSSSSNASTSSNPDTLTSNPSEDTDSSSTPAGYYKITLTRSAIGLGAAKKATLASLGIHRRMQTVFHPHKPEFAGKILAVKELVRVENVTEKEVKTKTEMRRERKPPKGFEVVGRLGEELDARP